MRVLIVILILIGFNSQASDEYQNAIRVLEIRTFKEADSLKKELEKADQYTSYTIDFMCDTFIVESMIRKHMRLDYSTYGMVLSIDFGISRYGTFIDIYYKQLLKILSDNDKAKLSANQGKWREFVSSESKLITTMSKAEYSGGGTLQSVTSGLSILKLYKQRLLMLYRHQRSKLYN